LKYDPSSPEWPDRDRFVLSAGHGSMLIYALAYLTGYEGMTLEQIENFRQLGYITAGHPELDVECGIEMTTGPLGQGIATAVGFALGERLMNARFGDDLVDHYTYVIASDGDLMEGVSHEACSLAGHLGLGRLIVLYDDNNISIDGSTDLSFSDDSARRFEAYGWEATTIDGHDADQIAQAIEAAKKTDKPTLICCKTTIGFGAPTKAGTAKSHGSPLGDEEIEGARAVLGWPHPAFEVPVRVVDAWRTAGAAGKADREAWELRLSTADAERKAQFEGAVERTLPADLADNLAGFKAAMLDEKPKLATRAASGKVLEKLTQFVPTMIGGSADLTGSVNTLVPGLDDIAAGQFGGRYVRYGVREHGMAAIMNGMNLHGGTIPYGGTFLQFADYARPSIRLAALMGVPSIFVMTHDSIGLGEDGPTHQPVEHLAAMRAMPNLNVMRPADIIEAAECWDIAVRSQTVPSLIVLSRQGVPTLRQDAGIENACAKGGYVIAPETAPHKVTLFGTGTELSIAAEAREMLEEQGIGTRLVSLVCWSLFDAQDASYRASVIGAPAVCGAVEAGVALGWERYIGPHGVFIGMSTFGASGKGPALYEHFGITAKATVAAIQDHL
ncbi:MAG: transketolase, partial [Pseudomonadota bacterium]